MGVIEGKTSWFQRWELRERLFAAAAFLSWQGGRALFYFFVGTVNLCLLPSNWLMKIVYFVVGGALCFVGVLMLLGHLGVGALAAKKEGDYAMSESEGSSA